MPVKMTVVVNTLVSTLDIYKLMNSNPVMCQAIEDTIEDTLSGTPYRASDTVYVISIDIPLLMKEAIVITNSIRALYSIVLDNARIMAGDIDFQLSFDVVDHIDSLQRYRTRYFSQETVSFEPITGDIGSLKFQRASD